MRTQRRHFLMLEGLDERVVPSAVGMAPLHHAHAAVATHAAIHAEAHHAKAHQNAQVKIHHNARVHHNKIVPAVQVSAGTHSAVQIGTGTGASNSAAAATASTTAAAVPSPLVVLAATGTGTGQVASVATSAAATPVASLATDTSKAPVVNPAATTNPGDIQNGPLAKAGQDLIAIYQEFTQQGGSATFTSSGNGNIRIVGGSVGIDVHSSGGNFESLVSAMTSLGMQVQSKDASLGIVEGLLPIGQLVAAAQNSQVLSLSPIYIRKTL